MDSKECNPHPVITNPNKEWDLCVQKAARTMGFGILAGTLISALVGAGLPVVWGTGICFAWSVKNCRALFRDGIITPEMIKERKEKEKQERERKKRGDQRKQQEEKMKKLKEREEKVKAVQQQSETSTQNECCKALEELKEQVDSKLNNTQPKDTNQKTDFPTNRSNMVTLNKKCEPKTKFSAPNTEKRKEKAEYPMDIPDRRSSKTKTSSQNNQETIRKMSHYNTANSSPQGEQAFLGPKKVISPNQTTPGSEDLKTNHVSNTNYSCVNNVTSECTGQEMDSKDVSKKFTSNSDVSPQNSSLPVKCNNVDEENGLVFKSATRVNVLIPHTATKFSTSLETFGTDCTCVVSGIDYSHQPVEHSDQPTQTKLLEDLPTTPHEIPKSSISNKELSTAPSDLEFNDSEEAGCDDSDTEFVDIDPETGPLSFGDILKMEGIETKRTYINEHDEEDEERTFAEEDVLFCDSEENFNEIGGQHSPKLQSNKNVDINAQDTYFMEKPKAASWPLPFSLPSLDRFQRKSNSSFKWPPLPSSVIVRPKKEPTRAKRPKDEETQFRNFSSHDHCTQI